jgi:hypothetical protein
MTEQDLRATVATVVDAMCLGRGLVRPRRCLRLSYWPHSRAHRSRRGMQRKSPSDGRATSSTPRRWYFSLPWSAPQTATSPWQFLVAAAASDSRDRGGSGPAAGCWVLGLDCAAEGLRAG